MCKSNSLLSLNSKEIEIIFPLFDKYVKEKISRYTLKGKLRISPFYKERKNTSLKGNRLRLKFYLMYLKHNPLQSLLEDFFELSQSKVSEWFHFLTDPFLQALKELKVVPKFGEIYNHLIQEEDYLLVDVVENQIPRQVDLANQKEEYSGKKKIHTMKYLGITNKKGYIHFLSSAYFGTVHDKKIWDDLSINTNKKIVIVDLGFQGIQNSFDHVIMPYKSSKLKPLTQTQKEINKIIGALRVPIEHAFAGVKRLRIIKDKIRIKGFNKREKIMKIAVALQNFRNNKRNSIRNQS